MNEVVTRPANIFIFFKVSYICLFPLLKKKKLQYISLGSQIKNHWDGL